MHTFCLSCDPLRAVQECLVFMGYVSKSNHPSEVRFGGQHPTTACLSNSTLRRGGSVRPRCAQQNSEVNMYLSTANVGRASDSLGFTLIELLVAIAIAAILLTVAVPSFRTTIASNRLTSLTNDMVATLAQARSEAIKRGARVSLCPSTNGTTCAAAGTNWDAGWISFVDNTRAVGGAAAVDPADTVLSFTQAPGIATRLRGSPSVAQYVSFGSDGSSRTMAGGPLTGTLRVCEPSTALTNTTRARDINITAVGRIETVRPAMVTVACAAP